MSFYDPFSPEEAEELGPHGTPIPPETWTPEREAEVAKWRDKLMAAGEKRDRARLEKYRKRIEYHVKCRQPIGRIGQILKIGGEEALLIYEQILMLRKEGEECRGQQEEPDTSLPSKRMPNTNSQDSQDCRRRDSA